MSNCIETAAIFILKAKKKMQLEGKKKYKEIKKKSIQTQHKFDSNNKTQERNHRKKIEMKKVKSKIVY